LKDSENGIPSHLQKGHRKMGIKSLGPVRGWFIVLTLAGMVLEAVYVAMILSQRHRGSCLGRRIQLPKSATPFRVRQSLAQLEPEHILHPMQFGGERSFVAPCEYTL
jgi:hypothetical protein